MATVDLNIMSKKKKRTRYVKPLTERQRAFAYELFKLRAEDGKVVVTTLKQAALNAGYAQSSAKQIGSELYKDPRIKEIVRKLEDEANKKAEIDRNKVLDFVVRAVKKALKGYPVIDKNGNKHAVRIEPCVAPLLDILCKCTGTYPDEKVKHEISGPGEDFGISINIGSNQTDEKDSV